MRMLSTLVLAVMCTLCLAGCKDRKGALENCTKIANACDKTCSPTDDACEKKCNMDFKTCTEEASK